MSAGPEASRRTNSWRDSSSTRNRGSAAPQVLQGDRADRSSNSAAAAATRNGRYRSAPVPCPEPARFPARAWPRRARPVRTSGPLACLHRAATASGRTRNAGAHASANARHATPWNPARTRSVGLCGRAGSASPRWNAPPAPPAAVSGRQDPASPPPAPDMGRAAIRVLAGSQMNAIAHVQQRLDLVVIPAVRSVGKP